MRTFLLYLHDILEWDCIVVFEVRCVTPFPLSTRVSSKYEQANINQKEKKRKSRHVVARDGTGRTVRICTGCSVYLPAMGG